eukprot:scaffold1827_cov421-Prasinococcus_capsulatus_cf.AAC.36
MSRAVARGYVLANNRSVIGLPVSEAAACTKNRMGLYERPNVLRRNTWPMDGRRPSCRVYTGTLMRQEDLQDGIRPADPPAAVQRPRRRNM